MRSFHPFALLFTADLLITDDFFASSDRQNSPGRRRTWIVLGDKKVKTVKTRKNQYGQGRRICLIRHGHVLLQKLKEDVTLNVLSAMS